MSSKSLVLGVAFGLLAVTACGSDTPKKPALLPYYPTYNLDAGSDAASLGGDGDQTIGDGDGDQTTFPGLDAGGGKDGSAARLDGSLGDAAAGDAALADGGSTLDASGGDAAVVDAGGQPDGAVTDAGGQQSDAAVSCGTSGLVAGNDCPGVVSCQDDNGKDVLSCELTGSTTHQCCYDDGIGGISGIKNSCRTSTCGALKTGACDGPEDCSGGKLCRSGGNGTSCQTTCSTANRLCHTDADCASGKKCVAGSGALSARAWWGFCGG